MPLVEASHDSLPYIDVEPTEKDRNEAERLVALELSSDHRKILHPHIQPLAEPKFSPLVEKEFQRKAADKAIEGGIDLSRYEAPDEPSSNKIDDWTSILRRAYSLNSYLSGRLTNLSLLEEFGKNSWLIANWQLEEILRGLEKELVQVKEATENVNKARKAAQYDSKGEIVALEEAWRGGVGKIIEVELATEGLRKEIQERRKQALR